MIHTVGDSCLVIW